MHPPDELQVLPKFGPKGDPVLRRKGLVPGIGRIPVPARSFVLGHILQSIITPKLRIVKKRVLSQLRECRTLPSSILNEAGEQGLRLGIVVGLQRTLVAADHIDVSSRDFGHQRPLLITTRLNADKMLHTLLTLVGCFRRSHRVSDVPGERDATLAGFIRDSEIDVTRQFRVHLDEIRAMILVSIHYLAPFGLPGSGVTLSGTAGWTTAMQVAK